MTGFVYLNFGTKFLQQRRCSGLKLASLALGLGTLGNRFASTAYFVQSQTTLFPCILFMGEVSGGELPVGGSNRGGSTQGGKRRGELPGGEVSGQHKTLD